MNSNDKYFTTKSRRKPKRLVPGMDKTSGVDGLGQTIVRDGVSTMAKKLKRRYGGQDGYFRN